jgi:ketosteroid isomerase-like protein
MSRENVEAIRSAFNPGSRFLAVFDEDVEFQAPDWGIDPGVFRGKDAIAEWLRQWIGAWDAYESESNEYIDAGKHVVVDHTQRGRSKETGLTLESHHWSVFTFS